MLNVSCNQIRQSMVIYCGKPSAAGIIVYPSNADTVRCSDAKETRVDYCPITPMGLLVVSAIDEFPFVSDRKISLQNLVVQLPYPILDDPLISARSISREGPLTLDLSYIPIDSLLLDIEDSVNIWLFNTPVLQEGIMREVTLTGYTSCVGNQFSESDGIFKLIPCDTGRETSQSRKFRLF